jgi:hypothetical protein
MRFTKSEMMEIFRQQDLAYRMTILASHWLRLATVYKPSAIDEARNLSMEVNGQWLSFSDIADELERDPNPITSAFVLNQLHTSIRAPLEDYDKITGEPLLLGRLRSAPWYVYARAIRNAVSHNFHFRFDANFRKLLPTTWRGITISVEHDGTRISWDTFGNKPGYRLLLEMKSFAEMLPERMSKRDNR